MQLEALFGQTEVFQPLQFSLPIKPAHMLFDRAGIFGVGGEESTGGFSPLINRRIPAHIIR